MTSRLNRLPWRRPFLGAVVLMLVQLFVSDAENTYRAYRPWPVHA